MKDINKNLELLATQIAEIRLSELGYRFIPGIYLVFRRLHRFVYAKALIVSPKGVQI